MNKRSKDLRYVVLFPGAWGNETADQVMWWFRFIVEFFLKRHRGIRVVPITYRGGSRRQVLRDIRRQLKVISPEYSMAVTYSTGGQVLRYLAPRWKPLEVLHISDVERGGTPIERLVKNLGLIWKCLFLSFFTGWLPLPPHMAEKVFGQQFFREVLEHSHRQLRRIVFQFDLPLLLPPRLFVPARAVIGDSDFFLGLPCHKGEPVIKTVVVPGAGHGLILDKPTLWSALTEVMK